MYTVQYSVQYSVQCCLWSLCCVQYSVSYIICNLEEVEMGLFLREQVSSASHFDVWLQFIVQYSVQCTVECTLYCSAQYRYVGCPGNQWDVTITKVIRKEYFLIAFRQNNLFPLLR